MRGWPHGDGLAGIDTYRHQICLFLSYLFFSLYVTCHFMVDTVWAKKSDGCYYPLVAHSVDVAAVLYRLVSETTVGLRFQMLTSERQADLAEAAGYMAMLHDMGKAQTGFRHQLGGGHVSPAVALLGAAARAPKAKQVVLACFQGPLQTYARWFGDQAAFDWLYTTLGHHGKPVHSESFRSDRWDDVALEGISKLCKTAELLYAQPDISITSTQAQHYFNGMLTLADWIASDEQFFPYHDRGAPVDNALSTDLDVIQQRAEERATLALQRIGLEVPRASGNIYDLVPDPHEPYSIQEGIEELPTHSGSCTVLESATGSGKTEAALARFARLQEAGQVDSLYFAVPTRAAATQLYGRVTEAKEELFDKPPQSVLAVPGYMKVDGFEGWKHDGDSYWSSNGRYERNDSDLRMRGWAAESSKRYTAAPIAVGTVDQALQCVVKNTHAHLRMAGLSRSLIVIDEVHSSSTYMEELLLRLVEIIKDAGGHVLLMSATLASESLARYRQIYHPASEPVRESEPAHETPREPIHETPYENAPEDVSVKEAKDKEYPSIAYYSFEEQSFDGYEMETTDKQVNVRVDLDIEDSQCIASEAAVHARKGAKVLVIRNTVATARGTFDKLPSDVAVSGAQGIPAPHHSRYVAGDRALLDEQIEEVYGKKSSRGDGIVTVATQTVEQSLDIDADVLITDICPMDVLLQRIGRLHRHNRSGRPAGYQEPLCLVAGLRSEYASLINPDRTMVYGPSGIGTVYADLRVLKLTQDLAEHADLFVIPRDNRVLVEGALHSENMPSGGVWQHHLKTLQSTGQYSKGQARQGMIRYDKAYTSDRNRFPNEFIPTRLGHEEVTIELPETVLTPFGSEIGELSIPFYDAEKAGVLDAEDVPVAEYVRQTDWGFTFRIGKLDMQYSARGLISGSR